MKAFRCLQIDEALAHAKAGGQALHLHKIITPDAPNCFKAAINRGEYIAHLFDLDSLRLIATARSLGVRVIFIDKPDTPRQHIDLCGKPLKTAMAQIDNPEEMAEA